MKFKSNIEIQAGLEDKDGQVGSSGQILASTGSQVDWIDPASIVTSATDVIIECKNTSGVTISKGTPVYQTGNVGATAVIEIAVADASDEDKMAAIGLLQSDLVNNAFGYVVVTGELLNITTSPIDGSTPTVGDTIYVKPGGGLTLTKPTGVNFIQNVGLIGKVSGGNAGSITVSSIMRSNDVPTPLYIDHDNQRLGIGTASPAAKLHVSDTTDFVSGQASVEVVKLQRIAVAGDIKASTEGHVSMWATDSNSNTEWARMSWVNDNASDSGLETEGALCFWTNQEGTLNRAMYIDHNQNVGIGTTSPDAKLDIEAAINPTIRLTNSTNPLGSADVGTLEFFTKDASTGASRVLSSIVCLNEADSPSVPDGQLAFKTSLGGANAQPATEKMRIDPIGNVGIGTTSPLAINGGATTRLHTKAGVLVSEATEVARFEGGLDGDGASAIVRINTSNDRGLYLEGGRTGVVNFGAIGTTDPSGAKNEAIRIDNAGNVGIGTTSPQSGGGAASWLSLNGTASYSGGVVYTIGSVTKAYSYFESDYLKQQAQGGYGQKFIVDGTNTAMTILSGGNVGIGVTNPDSKLHTYNSLYNYKDVVIESDVPSIRFADIASTENSFGMNIDGGKLHFSTYTYANRFASDSGARLITLTSAGNVGIGTPSPGYKLVSSVTSPGYSVVGQHASGGQVGIYSSTGDNGIGTINNYPMNLFTNNSGPQVTLTTAGNVGIGVTNPSAKLEVAGVTTIKSPKAYGSEEAVLRIGITPSGTNYSDGAFHNIVFGNESVTNSHLGEIQVVQEDPSVSTASDMRFFTNSGGGNTATNEAMRITSGGDVNIKGTNTKLGWERTSDGASNIAYLTKTQTISTNGEAKLHGYDGVIFTTAGSETERMRIDSVGAIKFNAYGAGTLVTDASGNITAEGGVWDGPYLPLAGGTLTGGLTGTTANFVGTIRSTLASDNSYYSSFSNNGSLVLDTAGVNSGMQFKILGSTKLTMLNSGNVGIGTTGPGAKLEVADSTPTIRLTNTDTSLGIDQVIGTLDFYKSDPSGSGVGVSSSIQVKSADSFGSSSYMAFHTDGVSSGGKNVERMRIDSVGNVTIKAPTASGGGVLNLENTTTAVNGTDWGSLNFISNDTSSSANGIRGSIVGTSTAYSGECDLVFSTAPSNGTATERMRITSAGDVTMTERVGIGVTSFTAGVKLEVAGAGSFTGTVHSNKLEYGGSSSTYLEWGINSITLATGSTSALSINSSQNVFIGAGSLTVNTSTVTATNFILSSDERLKENIEKACDNRIKADWKTFELKTEKGQKRYGVIAQELEKTNPEFVREDTQGFKSVAYIDLLIAKIAELEARLEKAGI